MSRYDQGTLVTMQCCGTQHGVQCRLNIYLLVLPLVLLLSQMLFSVYLGMSVYAKTRTMTLVEMVHEHMDSISCDKVLEISAQLGDAAVKRGRWCGLSTSSPQRVVHHKSHG